DANLLVHAGPTSVSGGSADGVLGAYLQAGNVGDITLVSGWNWYAGVNFGSLFGGQYDFQTALTHELGHALGLHHSADPTSVMYESLGRGVINRGFTPADLRSLDFSSASSRLGERSPYAAGSVNPPRLLQVAPRLDVSQYATTAPVAPRDADVSRGLALLALAA